MKIDSLNRKILITGGAGFIGSHLCKKIIDETDDLVFCLDNFYTGSKKNIENLLSNKRFNFINHDITSPLDFDVKIDQIYNLACPASPIFYQKDPIYTLKTCFQGVLNLLELAKQNQAVFLQASTSEVYGDPLVSPQPETYKGNVNPNGIRSCYDEGKRVGESLIFDFHRAYDLPIKVARIFNTYGPKMQINDGRVISNFMVQALLNDNLTVYGEGNQTRSFCYIDDLVEGLYLLMNSDKTITGPINLGNPEEMSILDTATFIIKTLQSKSQISHLPLPDDDPLQRQPDITLARDLLSWSPKVDIQSGILKSVDYFSELISA